MPPTRSPAGRLPQPRRRHRFPVAKQGSIPAHPDSRHRPGRLRNLDASLSLDDDEQKWRLTVLIKNILDRHYSSYLAHGDLAAPSVGCPATTAGIWASFSARTSDTDVQSSWDARAADQRGHPQLRGSPDNRAAEADAHDGVRLDGRQLWATGRGLSVRGGGRIPVAGYFVDRVGARWANPLAVGSWSLAAIAHAVVSTMPQFFAVRAALGATEALGTPTAVKTIAAAFAARDRTAALGTMNAAGSVGAILAPLAIPPIAAGAWLARDLHDYRRCRPPLGSAPGFIATRRIQWQDESAAEPEPAKGYAPWREALSDRRTWAIAGAKALSDQVWWVPALLDARSLSPRLSSRTDRHGAAAGGDLPRRRCRLRPRRLGIWLAPAAKRIGFLSCPSARLPHLRGLCAARSPGIACLGDLAGGGFAGTDIGGPSGLLRQPVRPDHRYHPVPAHRAGNRQSAR